MPKSFAMAFTLVAMIAAPAQAVEILDQNQYGDNQFHGNNAEQYYQTQNLLAGTHPNLVLNPPPAGRPCYPGNYSGNC